MPTVVKHNRRKSKKSDSRNSRQAKSMKFEEVIFAESKTIEMNQGQEFLPKISI